MGRQLDTGHAQLLPKESNLSRQETLALCYNHPRNGVMERLDVGNRKLRMVAARTADDGNVVQDDSVKTADPVSPFGTV